MTQDYQEIIDRFNLIKKAAWEMAPIPEGFDYACDIRCYQDLCQLFSGHRILKSISKEELFKKGGDYKNAYITEYKHTVLQAKIYKEDHERRLRASQAEARLIKEGKQMSCKEIFEAVFCELIPLLTDEVTGKKIREGAGLKLWTGIGDLSEDEVKEILKANKFKEAS